MAKELERAGIPAVLVTALPLVPLQMGVPRTLRGVKIPHPLGAPDRTPEAEKALRRKLIQRALFALQQTIEEPTVFELTEEAV